MLTQNEYLTFFLLKWFTDNMMPRWQVQCHGNNTLECSIGLLNSAQVGDVILRPLLFLLSKYII